MNRNPHFLQYMIRIPIHCGLVKAWNTSTVMLTSQCCPWLPRRMESSGIVTPSDLPIPIVLKLQCRYLCLYVFHGISASVFSMVPPPLLLPPGNILPKPTACNSHQLSLACQGLLIRSGCDKSCEQGLDLLIHSLANKTCRAAITPLGMR